MQISYRDLNEINVDKIAQSLRQNEWKNTLGHDTNTAYNTFFNILHRTLDTIAPVKSKTIHGKHVIREPWVTQGLMQSSKTMDKLYKKCLNKPSNHIIHTQFKHHRNLYNSLKRTMSSIIIKSND